ncbi:MAG: hypothetical protein KAU12_01735 [Candidatus Omnitrophica bacterium]|nr:hypothetical protein [Candidatus Omnitrophota bacterium]
MPDTFLLTIVFIAITTVITAFVKGKSRDRCLIDLSGDVVEVEMVNGKVVWGRLKVESTGLELSYLEKHKDEDGHDEYSYMLYKNEFAGVQVLVLYHDKLDEKSRKNREKELEKTYHPGFFRRFKRKIRNFFATVRDSILEVVNLFMGQAKKMSPAKGVLTSQDKYVNKMKSNLFGMSATAYEPLLEKHIGKKVVLELRRGDKSCEYVGVLKDYTAEFIEVIDISYKKEGSEAAKKTDFVVPRSLGIIRHLAEQQILRP